MNKSGMVAVCALACLVISGVIDDAYAQAYPSRPIRMFVGFAAGGGTDVSARIVAASLQKRIGQSVVVENRTGAGGLIAANASANAEPDGYTVLFSEVAAVSPVLVKNGIEALKVLTPVSNTQNGAFVMVARPSLAVNSWSDLLAYSKANPGKMNFGSLGTITDLVAGMLKARTGLDYVTVTYRGDAPAITALMAGDVDFAANNISGALPFVKSGKLKPLFVTKRTRTSLMPDVPTAAEVGISDFVADFNQGVWAPIATNKDIIQKLSAELVAAVKTPEVAAQFANIGAEPVGSTPEELRRTYEASVRFWTEAARVSKYEPQ